MRENSVSRNWKLKDSTSSHYPGDEDKYIRLSSLVHVPFTNMEKAGVMTYTAARHQGAISLWFWRVTPIFPLQLILGSWLNMIGALGRFIATDAGRHSHLLYPLMMVGQTIGAIAQPLIIFTPTKLAALWFPDHQRATANMIASMCEWSQWTLSLQRSHSGR